MKQNSSDDELEIVRLRKMREIMGRAGRVAQGAEIRNYASKFYAVTKEEYFSRNHKQHIFDTNDERYASLYVFI
jgi:hypothetical protein